MRRRDAVETSGVGHVYDAVFMEEYFARRPLVVLARLLVIAGAAASVLLAAASDQVFSLANIPCWPQDKVA